MPRTGSAVTSTVAVAIAAVARSALSARDAPVAGIPSPRGAMSTVAATGAREVPARIDRAGGAGEHGAPPLSAQLQPVAVGAALKVSPEGSVAVRVGSL